MKNGTKWVGAAAILLLAACKDKDPLKEVRGKIEIKSYYEILEGWREQVSDTCEKIHYDKNVGGTVTNNSDKDLTDVVLAMNDSQSDAGDGKKYFEIGDLPSGESRTFHEFLRESNMYMLENGKPVKPYVWLHSATVAGAKP